MLFVFGLLASAGASAQTYTYSVYVDNDVNASSGCVVPGFAGAEARLEAEVTGGVTPQVVAVRRSTCTGGTFGAPTQVGGGYPVGLNNGIGGADVIELSDTIAALRPTGQTSAFRFGVIAQSATGSDELVVNDTGGPILLGLPQLPIPALTWPILLLLGAIVAFYGARRARKTAAWRVLSAFLFVSSAAIAANFVTDGQVGDWAGVSPLANDPAGDPTSSESAIDLLAIFGATENGRVFVRLDVRDLENNPPTVTPSTLTVLEDTLGTATLTGTDPEGATITFAIATAPTLGTLGAVTPTGPTSATVDYTPNANANGNDSFTYTGNDGQGSSIPATVSVVITPVNDAPGFTAGADVAVPENAGAQTVANWATAITAGPADEAAQVVTFNVTIVSAT
ncbi:MAG TPA: Ig-like domain-containing protein, partial [Tahibacter sp.]|nr:Ig-like domain-containing protein [Tahibacter sp.]